MEIVKKSEISIDSLPGRGLIRAIGKNSYFYSSEMTVGYAIYNGKYGEMEPHHHAEETCVIVKSIKGWLEWGDSKENLSNKVALEEGMILHIPENEWHVFKYGTGGEVEIIFIYGTTSNTRPEDNNKGE